jgi:NAD(P)-dependent dehydrogenase (short-subunit alcohol dehydrogenase family)
MVGNEYSSQGVASFVICLGFVDTAMVRNMALGRPLDGPDPEVTGVAPWTTKYEEWAGQIPAKRIASPAELAKLVEFLVSPEAEYLSGTVFSFSGGLDRGLT